MAKQIVIVDSEGNFTIEEANVNGHPHRSISRVQNAKLILGIDVNEHGHTEIDVIKTRGDVYFI